MTTAPTEHRAKIAEARNVLGEVIARARFGGEATILVNRGKDAAVVVGPEFYEQAKADAAVLRQLRAYADEKQAAGDASGRQIARTVSEALAIAERDARSSD
ncbi:type II toxin-antitoxin system prevent-host-death family antitoxin [Streptomyces niveus]|uniref:type II toxin-antitoxin system prevent-host-death family antitoxin n=1 Tax=Streptomyces niveus TaxID=193462 RepID=UPI0034470E1B